MQAIFNVKFFGIIKNVFIFAPYFCYTEVKRNEA